jgi:hypothetical protein
MRISLLPLALLVAAAFLIGRATAPSAAPAARSSHDYTGHLGDVFRVPAASTRCVVGQEGGVPRTSCSHAPVTRARYSVVFYRNNLLVYRNGRPDNPVFSARGRP